MTKKKKKKKKKHTFIIPEIYVFDGRIVAKNVQRATGIWIHCFLWQMGLALAHPCTNSEETECENVH